MREGQTLTRLSLRYRVDNAAVKQLRPPPPGLSESRLQTVRGTGSAVNDLVQIPGEKDLWEIRFQRGIAGETDVQIEHRAKTARDQGKEAILPPTFESARQITQFVSRARQRPHRARCRSSATRLAACGLGRHSRLSPKPFGPQRARSCFRVAEPEGPFPSAFSGITWPMP